MTHKVYVVTDLGPGDGGKGGVVHKIATMMRAHTVIKRGGAQGSHGVVTSKGERFAFSQWGCGTFEGIPTHLSQQMIVSPEGLLNEAAALRYQHGIHTPFALLTVDERALCATPFHGIASRLKEMALGKNPRGTVGTGVGEAYRYLAWQPDLAIRAGDLSQPDLPEKLAAVREQIQKDLEPIIGGDFLATDYPTMVTETTLLYDDDLLSYVIGRFREAADQVNVVNSTYLADEILSMEGVAVVESSHGVLTDRLAGFHPHTSAIRTLPEFTSRMLAESGYEGQVVNLGVTRAYAIRHGAGPLPTYDPRMAEYLLPGSHKDANRYQGEVRVGPLDTVLLNYAVDACGGPEAFDGLAVTWFDQIRENGIWHTCNTYEGSRDPALFSPDGKIRVSHESGIKQLDRQAAITAALANCVPQVSSLEVPKGLSSDDMHDLCTSVMESTLGLPVRMVSLGPTERDKLCK